MRSEEHFEARRLLLFGLFFDGLGSGCGRSLTRLGRVLRVRGFGRLLGECRLGTV